MPLCNSCYDDYYTTCECCGRIIHRDYANYDDDDDFQDDTVYEKIPAQPAADAPDAADAE